MGLDQNAYAQNKNGEDEHLADWRKHNRLQGWMEDLWNEKGRPNAEKEFRIFLARLIFFIENRYNLKPTRNASSPPISACDAVSVAMTTLPAARGLKPNSFDELARIYAKAEKSGAFVS